MYDFDQSGKQTFFSHLLILVVSQKG